MMISRKDLVFRRADKSQMDVAFDLLKEAASWLRSSDIDHWQNWLNPSDSDKRWISDGFDKKQFFFVYYKSEIIAMFRLQWEDRLFWGDVKESAGYVHSLVTSRKYKGLGLGELILGWVGDYCRKEGKTYLRLDCRENNSGLRSYYERHGFKKVGISPYKEERQILYQKKL